MLIKVLQRKGSNGIYTDMEDLLQELANTICHLHARE